MRDDLATRIEQRLISQLQPTSLQLINESHLHIGHEGAKSGAHFALAIAAPSLVGKSRIEAHRQIYAALEGIMGTEVHALRIKIMPPEQQR